MKVRTKIALLLLLVVGTFVAGLFVLRIQHERRFRHLTQEYERARQKSFDALVKRWTQPIEVLANDYSCWDAMVAAVTQRDVVWAEQNLGEEALGKARANAIWVYASDHRLFHSYNNLYSESLFDAPLPLQAIGSLLDDRKLCHFFAQTPVGFFEIRGATIHPSRDGARVTPPQGYLLVGHFWSREDLKDVSVLTGHNVEIVPAERASGRKPGDESVGLVTFTRELPGWDGKPLAKFVVRNESIVLSQLHHSTRWQLIWIILFGVMAVFLLVFFLVRWVDRPIRALSTCLRTRSLEPIRGLEEDPSEFGDLARMIQNFFKQRDALLQEITNRYEAEKALQESEKRLLQLQKQSVHAGDARR